MAHIPRSFSTYTTVIYLYTCMHTRVYYACMHVYNMHVRIYGRIFDTPSIVITIASHTQLYHSSDRRRSDVGRQSLSCRAINAHVQSMADSIGTVCVLFQSLKWVSPIVMPINSSTELSVWPDILGGSCMGYHCPFERYINS